MDRWVVFGEDNERLLFQATELRRSSLHSVTEVLTDRYRWYLSFLAIGGQTVGAFADCTAR